MGNNTNTQAQTQQAAQQTGTMPTKFCKNCGGKIAEKAVICPLCGCQVEEMQGNNQQPQIVINNANTNTNTNTNQNIIGATGGRMKNKWMAFLLCFFLGYFGAHKFYEGKAGSGVLYLMTFGLFGFGWMIDCLILLCKPNPYYV